MGLKPLMKRFTSRLKNNEDGAVAVIAAVSMVCFLGMLALALDVGMVYLNTGKMQKIADASIYSAGRLLPVEVSDISAQNEIKDSVISYAALNGFDGLNRDDVELNAPVHGFYTQLKVTVVEDFELCFAKTFGWDSVSLSRSARAKLSPVSKKTGLAPLGVRRSELEGRIESGDLENVVLKYGVKSGESSFFGALDLSGKGGGSDYRLWLAHGYDGEICLGDILYEQPGNLTGPTYQGFSVRFDSCTHYGATTGGPGCTIDQYDTSCPRIITVAVYERKSLSTVSVCGFAAFLLKSQTQDGFITGSFLSTISDGQASGEDVGSGEADFGVYNLVLTD